MRLLPLMVVLFAFNVSHAQQIIFAPAFSYQNEKHTDKENSANDRHDKKDTLIDLKLAYLHHSGLYLGALYSTNKYGDNKATSVGPTLGYSHYTGFYALFSYHLMSKYEYANGSELNDGMGAQVDIGWVFPLTSMFSIGPQITYRSINYKKFEDSTGDRSIDQTKTSLNPYISLWFQF